MKNIYIIPNLIIKIIYWKKNNEREYSTKNNTKIGNSLYKSQISENNSYIKNFLK